MNIPQNERGYIYKTLTLYTQGMISLEDRLWDVNNVYRKL